MAPDVFLRKLTYLRQLLADLEPYRQVTLAEVEAEHYKLERLIELLVMTASDLLRHLLAGRGLTPVTYRDTFYQAGKQGIIPPDLAERLQKAAGMRNILVHLTKVLTWKYCMPVLPPPMKTLPILWKSLNLAKRINALFQSRPYTSPPLPQTSAPPASRFRPQSLSSPPARP